MPAAPPSKPSPWLGLFKVRKVITHPVFSVIFVLFALVGLGIEATGFYRTNNQSVKKSGSLRATNALRLVTVCHYLHCLVAIHFARQASKRVPEFLKSWLKISRATIFEGPTSQESINRLGSFTTLSCFGGIFAFSTFVAAISFHSSIERISTDFDFNDTETLLIVKDVVIHGGHYQMLKCAAIAFTMIPNLYMQGMYTNFCGIVYYEFCVFQARLVAACEKPAVASNVATFREQHFSLSKLARAVDDLSSYYIAWIYCLNLPCVGVIAYSIMLGASLSTQTLMLLLGWLLILLLHFLICCIPPSAITSVAHAPLLTLEDLVSSTPPVNRDNEGENSNTEQLLREDYAVDSYIGAELFRQVSLFVQQLTGSVVGVTCGGFFFIRKEALLTLSSALITYFALLLRMNLASGDKPCECNCAAALLLNSTKRYADQY